MQHPLVEIRLRRRGHSAKAQNEQHIPTQTMILIHTLRIIHTPIQPRRIILRDPNNSLNRKQYIRNQPQNRMR